MHGIKYLTKKYTEKLEGYNISDELDLFETDEEKIHEKEKTNITEKM